MEVQQSAPGAAVEPEAPATPEPEAAEEQGQEPEPEAGADTSAAEPSQLVAQREFTRSQQAFSEAKTVLGLERTATREDVIAAIKALNERPAADDEGVEVNPEVEAANERAWNAELRYATAIYGEDFGKSAIDVVNLVRTTNDPAEILQAFAAFVDAHGGTAAVAEPETDEEEEAPGDQPVDIGTSEGDNGPSARSTVQPARRGESGAIGAVRGIFRELGIGSDRPTQ